MKKLLIVFVAAILFLGCEEKKEVDQERAKRADESVDAKNELRDDKVSLDAVEEGLHITDAWIRPAGKARNTGLFFRVINNTDQNDTLLSAKSDLAAKTEVHETFKVDDMMGMREVENLVMEAGKVFQFKPMSYHVMLIQLKEAVAQGDEGEVTLVFKNAGEVKVKAMVEDKMPTMKAGEKKQEEM